MIQSKYFKKFAQICIALSFFVPLIVIPSQFIFPFIVPKVIIFRSLVLLMLASYTLLLVSNWEKYKPRVSWIHIGVFLFLLSFVVSTFFGVDSYRSFWDNHERMLGLFSVLHYVLFYYIASAVMTEWREWRLAMRTFLLAGFLVMGAAFVQQYINPEFVLNQGQGSVHATLGNPIYVGGYGVFLAFLALLLYTKDRDAGKYWQYFYWLVAASGLFGVYASGQRGPFLGLLATVGTAIYVYAYLYDEKKYLRKIAVYGTVVGVALIGLIFFYRNTDFVQDIPMVGGLATIQLDEGTAETRIMAWKSAITATKDRPVFGWGPRNYYFAFNKYYNPELLSHGYGETWFDNAHNILMETLATRGIFGLVTYIGLFVTIAIALVKGYRDGKLNAHEVALSAAFITGHFVHNLFVFEDPTSYLYFFFILAYINQRVGGLYSSEAEQIGRSKNITYGLATFTAAVAVLLIYTTNINPARANSASLDTMRAIRQGQGGLESFNKALSIPSPHKDVIRADIGRSVISVVPKYLQANKGKHIEPLFDKAYEEINKNIKLHPREIRNYMKKAQLAQSGAVLKQDPSYFTEAEKALETALEYSPKRQQLQYMLANLKIRLGKQEEAINILTEARDNAPEIGESWWRLALLHQQAGQSKKAKSIIKEAQDKGIKFDSRGKKVAQQILGSNTSTTSTNS